MLRKRPKMRFMDVLRVDMKLVGYGGEDQMKAGNLLLLLLNGATYKRPLNKCVLWCSLIKPKHQNLLYFCESASLHGVCRRIWISEILGLKPDSVQILNSLSRVFASNLCMELGCLKGTLVPKASVQIHIFPSILLTCVKLYFIILT